MVDVSGPQVALQVFKKKTWTIYSCLPTVTHLATFLIQKMIQLMYGANIVVF